MCIPFNCKDFEMGCCTSVDNSSSSLVKNPAATGSHNSGASNPGVTVAKEDQIALAFKAKRANVFSESVETDTRRAFAAKNIPKSPKQELLIS